MAIETQLVKATSKNFMYAGVAVMVIGGFLYYKKSGWAGPVMFIGVMLFLFWLSGRKDQMCSYDEQTDKEVCVDIPKK